MIRFYLLILMLMFISCDSLRQQEDRLSEDFITPSFSIIFFGSNGVTKYDSIKVGWTAIENEDEMGHIIYPKAVNTMTDCHGNKKTIVAGNSSYPSYRVDDCPNKEYIFKLTNATGDSMVYRIPFDFDGSFYAQKFDFINGGTYKKHIDQFENGVCEHPSISTYYYRDSYGFSEIEYSFDKNTFSIPPVDSVAKILAIDKNQLKNISYLRQGCRYNISIKNSRNINYFVNYAYYYTF